VVSTAIYTRISRDRTGAGLGVARQEKEIRESLRPSGAVVVFSDNDVSAYSGKPRPGYRAMMEAVKDGEISEILAWHTDRLHRSNAELETFISAIDAAGGIPVRTKVSGLLDLATGNGRMMARIVGAVAQAESEQKSERILSKHREIARNGGFHGGRRRFGFEPAMHAVRESEAVYVRELAERLLSGESLNAITKDWNARGIHTISGKPWAPANLRAMILGAHHAGLRTFQNEITGEAAWEPTLPRETWEAVRAILLDPSRRTGVSTTRKYVLTGVGECGVCGGKIRGRMAGSGASRQPSYICESTKHVHRPVNRVDEIITAIVGDWLAGADTDGTLFATDEGEAAKALTAEADQRRARRAQLDADYGLGDIDKATHHNALAAIDARLREITAALGDLAKAPAVLDGLVGQPHAADLFAALPLERRRAVLAAMPGTVVLNPAARRGAPFDPATVEVRWED
jgi:site-specific DNA recombinase